MCLVSNNVAISFQLLLLSIQQVQLKLWKSKDILGAAAGRYHSVFFTKHEVYTCGLNAGQLGMACPIVYIII